jgi:beta-mannosidase
VDPLDLSGAWRAHPSDGELPKQFPARAFRDDAWPSIDVPGHWRSTEAFADLDGPVLYRRTFASEPPAAGARRFLELDGVFYFSDVWLDGEYVGATEGYFVPHAFEVTEALRTATEHVLAVEVACPPQRDRTKKRTVTGVFSHWDNLDPAWNPGGIWRPVRVRATGPVRLAALRTLCTEAAVGRARLLLDLTLDAAEADTEARLVAALTGPDGRQLARAEREATLAAGDNRLRWTLDVEDPPRWWPWRLGEQPLCDLRVDVVVGDVSSDHRAVRTALREVRLRDWVLSVNGERLFVMGTNQGPARMALAEATPELLRDDVRLAREANLDMVRLHAHVSRPELYDAADELGVLLWQDLPLQWGYARSVRRQAVRQARTMVDLLGHHPSIVLWCAHNEPLAVDLAPGIVPGPRALARLAASMFLPTWNKDVLDRSVARALARSDPSRPVDRSSGILPGLGSTGTDTHWYFGWYHGGLADLPGLLRRVPRLGRFVSEFGAQAVPDTDEWIESRDAWPDLDWNRLRRHHAYQPPAIARSVPPEECKTFDEWRDATQAYQAALLQLQIEDLRRLKWSPTGGFLQFCFADGHPSITWSVLDHARRPKRGYGALRDACRPVLPVLDPRTGGVHVVSELPEALADAVVDVALDGTRRRFTGEVAADAVTFVARVPLDDAVDVEVVLEHPRTGRVVNRYPLLLLDACRDPRPS